MRARLRSSARPGLRRALAGAALLAVPAFAAPAVAGAQDPDAGAPAAGAPDMRWRPFVGCWAAVGPDGISTGGATVCVVPEAGGAVELATVTEGRVAARERVAPNGARIAVRDDDCTGWRSAQWSGDGRRVYLTNELTCSPGIGASRRGSGVLALTGGGDLLDVRGLTMSGAAGGVRSVRLRPTTVPEGVFPAAVRAELADAAVRWRDERLLAAATLVGERDVIEASRQVDAPVVQAWLGARRQGFALDARGLRTLAEGGVAPGTIDVMVALSNPRVFAVNPETGATGAAARDEARVADAGRRVPVGMWPGWGLDPWGFGFAPFGNGFGFNRWGNALGGFGGGWGWSPWANPVVIVNRPGAGQGTGVPQGRVRRGEGYVFGDGGGMGRPTTSASPSGGGASRGGYSGGASSGGGGGGRTARPRQ